MNILRREPAVILYVINAAVAAAVAYGLPLSHTQTAAITTITTAILAGVAAAMTRPVEVSVLVAAGVTGVTALASFGLHLSQDQIGTGAALLSVVLALLLRQAVSPVPAVVTVQERPIVA